MFVLYDETIYNGEERGYFDEDHYPHWTDFDHSSAYYEFEEAQEAADLWNKSEGYNLKVIEVE